MEAILKGIVNSDHSENIKDQLIKRTLKGVDEMSESSRKETLESIFPLLMEWILSSDSSPHLVEMSLQKLVKFGKRDPKIFLYKTLNIKFLLEIFIGQLENFELNFKSVIPFINILLEILTQEEVENDDDYSNNRRIYMALIPTQIPVFLKNYESMEISVALDASNLYKTYPQIFPNRFNELKKLSDLFIEIILRFKAKSKSWSNLQKFINEIDDCSKILPLIWKSCSNDDYPVIIEEAIKSIYIMVSTVNESYDEASPNLMFVIDKIPHDFRVRATKNFVQDSLRIEGEARVVMALQVMLNWLTIMPNSTVAEWVHYLLKSLREAKSFSVLEDLTHSTIEKLCQSLVLPTGIQTEKSFFFLLLGFQHSESVFHKLVPILPQVFNKLIKMKEMALSNNQEMEAPSLVEQIFLDRLMESVSYLVDIFPNHSELYKPIEEFIPHYKLSPEKIHDLKGYAWRDSSSLTTLNRSKSGMVGLVNLGNSCYMNSVLQVLFMTKEFSNAVLQAPINSTSNQVLLHRLQIVFTFLKFSLREIYAPEDFYKSAGPPWFECGRQQDCSEFLKYLLDTLHEQEKFCHSKTPYQQQQLQHRGGGGGGGGGGESSLLNVLKNDECDESLLRQSTSATALNSIEESTAEDDDNEVLLIPNLNPSSSSQLSSNSDVEMGDVDEDDDENVLRINSNKPLMKRWTTEENLSDEFNQGSRDSGIQSVGDSIRGSSDSMMNPNLASIGGLLKSPGQSSSITLNDGSSAESLELVSLVQKVFGGKMSTSYSCKSCESVSTHDEVFFDLNLPIQKIDKKDETNAQLLSIQSLINQYLEPEELIHENQYHCDKCGSLQNALKTIQFHQGPSNLMCNLLRFRYDKDLKRRCKVFTDILYDRNIRLPIGNDTQEYSLYAIIIHSGYSTDGGHYYCYIKDTSTTNNDEDDSIVPSSDDKWCIFNDSNVSKSSFQSFENLSKTFPRDTAYVLLYQRKDCTNNSDETSNSLDNLRTDLKSMVERDNKLFTAEKERRNNFSRWNKPSVSTSSSSSSTKKDSDEDDDDDDYSSPPSFGGLDNFNRFIC